MSQPNRPFGPSNWTQRPDEVRSKILKRESASGRNDGMLAREIWNALNLMHEQAREALNRRERSPDSFWEIASKIRGSMTAIHNKHPEIAEWLGEHMMIIANGVMRFGRVPTPYVQKHGSARIQRDPRQLSDTIGAELSELDEKRLLDDYYLWELVADMLDIVATYEDSEVRKDQAHND